MQRLASLALRSAIALMSVLGACAGDEESNDEDSPRGPTIDGGPLDGGPDARRVWVDETFYVPPPPDCSPLASSYKFYLEGERLDTLDTYTVSATGEVARGAAPSDAGVQTCSGSLAACGTLALDITDFRKAFNYASEEWWSDGTYVIGLGGDPRQHGGQVLVVERSTDGKKLVLGDSCGGGEDYCLVAPGQYTQLFDGLRTQVAFASQSDAGDAGRCE